MKTSNKILIALAVALIIIPIIVVTITVKLNYADQKSAGAENKTIEHFATPTVGFVSSEINKPFTRIQVTDAKGLFLNIQLIKDSKSGIKISENDKNLINFETDGNGVLQITIKDTGNNKGNYSSIVIYSPNFIALSMAKGRGLSLTANVDSLQLDAGELDDVSIGSETKMKTLNATLNKVGRLNFDNNLKVDVISLNLKNSNFESERTFCKSLTVNAYGNSDIAISGENNSSKKFQIENLYIKTTGKSNLKVEDIIVNKSSGSLSDSTTVNMSAAILKTMFNK